MMWNVKCVVPMIMGPKIGLVNHGCELYIYVNVMPSDGHDTM